VSQGGTGASFDRLAKFIQDLQDLVALLLRGLSRAKPWQRQLAAHLGDIEKQVDVLRLTVAMERHDSEILAAADHLAGICRLSAAALAGKTPTSGFPPGSDHAELFDPNLPRVAVEQQLQWETFDAWVDAYPSDIQSHDAASVDETIAYWRSEKAAGESYYGDENEEAPALGARH